MYRIFNQILQSLSEEQKVELLVKLYKNCGFSLGDFSVS